MNLFAQKEKSPDFFGINPSITVEPYYNKGEWDVNILPWVWQKPISKRIDLRFNSILNLGIRNTGNVISHFGLEIAAPVFLRKKSQKNECSKDWFIAPILSLTQNATENRSHVGIWCEPGYSLLFENRFAVSFGLQLGMTSFITQQSEVTWGNHFGFKIIFGKWFL